VGKKKDLIKKIQKIIDDSLIMTDNNHMPRSDLLNGEEFNVCVLESKEAAIKIYKLLEFEIIKAKTSNL